MKKDTNILLKESYIGIIRGTINAVPYLGGAINEVLFDISNRIKQKRVEQFTDLLKTKVNELEENKIDQEYLYSDDFYDLTRLIFDCVLKSKSNEKQKALSKVYLNAIMNKVDIESDLSILYAKFIVDLIPLEISILSFVEQNEEKLIEIGTYKKFFSLFIEWSKYIELSTPEFKYSCNDLENKALISMGAGLDDFDSTSNLFAAEEHKEASVKLTKMGIGFLKILK